jgi:hypothetical protein
VVAWTLVIGGESVWLVRMGEASGACRVEGAISTMLVRVADWGFQPHTLHLVT